MMSSESFKPPWWLDNGHLQTLFPALFRQLPALTRYRERLLTADGDFFDVDFHGDGDKPLVIILHGLTGSSASVYVYGIQAALHRAGFRSVAMNFRGCSGEPNDTALSYHSGETGDTDLLYRTLRCRYPELPMAAIGFSLGGNVLLKWLGEQGSSNGLFAAVAVSVPLVLGKCADRLDRGFSRLYRNLMINELKTGLREKQRCLRIAHRNAELEKLWAIGDLSRVVSFWEYDERVIARLYGFTGAADYYRLNSSRQFLHRIRIPTLLVQADDDPFMTEEILPRPDELSSMVCLEITRGGGHVGFICGGTPYQPDYWLEKRIPAFLRAQLECAAG